MEPKKNDWPWILGCMVVFGMVAEMIRDVANVFLAMPKLATLPVVSGRWIWNPLGDIQWLGGFLGFLADSIAAGVGVVLAISLFTNTKEVAPGSGRHAIIGALVGVPVTMILLPGVTLMQAAWLAAGVGVYFGAALGSEFIGDAELFGAFGMVLGMAIWTFLLCGGVVGLLVMATLLIVNGVGIVVGFIIGCAGAGTGGRIARKKA